MNTKPCERILVHPEKWQKYRMSQNSGLQNHLKRTFEDTGRKQKAKKKANRETQKKTSIILVV